MQKSSLSSEAFLQRLSWPPSNTLVLAPQAALSLKEYLRTHPKIYQEDLALLIGPEGGFSEQESKALKACSYPFLSLGPHILRVATAVQSSLAQLT